MDAVDEVLYSEPVAERLHQDLAYRLRHHGLPITTVGKTTE